MNRRKIHALFIPFLGICLALPFSAAAATIDTLDKLDLPKKEG